MDRFKDAFIGQLKALRPGFLSSKPHFHFISAHCKYSGKQKKNKSIKKTTLSHPLLSYPPIPSLS